MAGEPAVGSDALRARVAALAESVATVMELDPVVAARSAPRIIDEAKAVMSAVRKTAITTAARTMTHAQIAAELGVSASAVNNAIVEHRASVSPREGARGRVEEGIAGV